MANFRLEQKKNKMNLEYIVVVETQEILKE